LSSVFQEVRIVLQAVEQPRVGGPVGQLAGLHAVVGKVRLGLGQRQVEVVEQPLPAAAHQAT
jgi:hypothetical protein